MDGEAMRVPASDLSVTLDRWNDGLARTSPIELAQALYLAGNPIDAWVAALPASTTWVTRDESMNANSVPITVHYGKSGALGMKMLVDVEFQADIIIARINDVIVRRQREWDPALRGTPTKEFA